MIKRNKRQSPIFSLPRFSFLMTGDAPKDIQNATNGAVSGASMGSMAGPFAAGVGAVAGGLLGLFGGGGQTQTSGLTLPPELEYQYLQDFSKQREQLQQLYTQSTQMAQQYQERFNILSDTMSGLIPAKESLAALTSNTLSLVNASGQSVQDLVKNGFLSDSDMEDLNSLKALESADFKDPVFEKARSDEKLRLLQQMRRGGASDQQIQQFLSRFDMDTTLGSFQASQQLKQSQAGLISNRIGIGQQVRQGNFGIAQQQIQTGLQAGSQYAGLIGQQGSLNQAGYQIGSTGIQQQQQILDQQQQGYTTAGGFKFSKTAKNLIKQGKVEGIGAVPITSGQKQMTDAEKRFRGIPLG